MYKDKQKQREASRERQRRYKSRQKALPEQGVTQGVTKFRLVNKLDPTNGDVRIVQERVKPKRGKDIKCFEDLPLDVQQMIDRVSESREEKLRFTSVAIAYQHTFPDSFQPHSDPEFTRLLAQAGAGHIKVSKPGDEDYVPLCEKTKTFCAETGGGEGGGLCG